MEFDPQRPLITCTMIKRLVIVALAIMGSMLFSACLPTTEQKTNNNIYDPRIPGGSIGADSGVDNVSNISLTAAAVGKNTMSWALPTKYRFLNYKVYIYRKQCTLNSSNCNIPIPSGDAGATSYYKVYSSPDEDATQSSFSDTTITNGEDYIYMFCARLNASWSSTCETKGVTALSVTQNSLIADAALFWEGITWRISHLIGASEAISIQNSNPGTTTAPSYSVGSFSPSQFQKGKITIAKDGALLYYLDTDNNRIIIYSKSLALQCESISDATTKQACQWQAAGSPYQAVNILGQQDQTTNRSCQEWQTYCSSIATQNSCQQNRFCGWSSGVCDVSITGKSSCLTKPTHALVDGERLIISDSGNDRVVIHDSLPITNGCDTSIFYQTYSTLNCAADKVIGKKGLGDLTSYLVTVDGWSSLKSPGSLAVKGNDLYIADQGNHRIVSVESYADDSHYFCNTNGSNWGQAGCMWHLVLGQKNPTDSPSTLVDEITGNGKTSMIDVGVGAGNTLLASKTDYLKRHFANPLEIKFTPSGDLAVGAFEGYTDTSSFGLPMAINGRILIFPYANISGQYPICNAATFESGGCDASMVIGQSDFATIPIYSTAVGSYDSAVVYGLTFPSDFLFIGTQLLTIDPITNKIHFWSDWASNVSTGKQADFKIVNPSGQTSSVNPGTTLPNLGAISGIGWDATSSSLVISDSANGQILQVKLAY